VTDAASPRFDEAAVSARRAAHGLIRQLFIQCTLDRHLVEDLLKRSASLDHPTRSYSMQGAVGDGEAADDGHGFVGAQRHAVDALHGVFFGWDFRRP